MSLKETIAGPARAQQQKQNLLGSTTANARTEPNRRTMPPRRLLNTVIDENQREPLLLSMEDLWTLGIRVSRGQIYKMMKRHGFPEPIRLSTHRIAWIASEVEAYIEARKADRSA